MGLDLPELFQRLFQPLLLFPASLLARTDVLALFPLHLLDVLPRHLQVLLQPAFPVETVVGRIRFHFGAVMHHPPQACRLATSLASVPARPTEPQASAGITGLDGGAAAATLEQLLACEQLKSRHRRGFVVTLQTRPMQHRHSLARSFLCDCGSIA